MVDEAPLRFGVAGMSSDHTWEMGDGLAALPGVRLVAAADPAPALRERAAGRWGLAAYPDHRQMLAAERLDAVLVCADNAAKAGIVEAAAARGVHVYQDKPMAATLAQADRSARAAEAAGIVLMVAFHTLFTDAHADARALVRAGAIGTPFLARGIIGHAGPVEYGCSPFFCGWLFDAERNGGGSFIDEACYRLAEFGDIVGPIAEVSGFAAPVGSRPYLPPGVEDNAVAVVRFAGGALGVLDAKWGQVGAFPVDSAYHGTAGTLAIGPGGIDLWSMAEPALDNRWLEVADERLSAAAGAPIVRHWRRPPDPPGGLCAGGAEQRAFVDGLRRSVPVDPAVGAAGGRAVQAAIEAFYRSAADNRTRSVADPPEPEPGLASA